MTTMTIFKDAMIILSICLIDCGVASSISHTWMEERKERRRAIRGGGYTRAKADGHVHRKEIGDIGDIGRHFKLGNR